MEGQGSSQTSFFLSIVRFRLSPGAFALHNGRMSPWVADAAVRLDAFLAAEGRMLSRVKAQKSIDAKLVMVNGKICTKASHKLTIGDTVEVTGELPASGEEIVSVDLHLPILHEDAACWVIDKPAGIAVHPGTGMELGEQTILHGIKFLYEREGIPFSADAALVHRLDRETTGCLLVAKNAAAHQALQKQFETRTVRKLYLALVSGVPQYETAAIDSPIGRSAADRTKMSVRGVSGVREAKTTYRVLESSDHVSLVECDLHTGRTHQVRVHLQSIGHPVLGDPSYTNNQSVKLTETYGVPGLCLHAWRVSFASPADGKTREIESPLPAPFEKSLKKTGIGWRP